MWCMKNVTWWNILSFKFVIYEENSIEMTCHFFCDIKKAEKCWPVLLTQIQLYTIFTYLQLYTIIHKLYTIIYNLCIIIFNFFYIIIYNRFSRVNTSVCNRISSSIFSSYESRTFRIGGIGCAFWSRGSADILHSVLQGIRTWEFCTWRKYIGFLFYSSRDFVSKIRTRITRSFTYLRRYLLPVSVLR